MRYVMIAGLLLLGACSGDPLWTACDGQPGSCGDGFVCVPLTHEPLSEPPGYYCARSCSEFGGAGCEDLAGESNYVGCHALDGEPRYCGVHGCEADADCPDGLRCTVLSTDGHPGTCEP